MNRYLFNCVRKHNTNCFLSKLFINILCESKNKHELYINIKENIISNQFVSIESKNRFINSMHLYNKVLFVIDKCKYKWKLKKYKKYDIDTTIDLTPFSEINKNKLIHLIENDIIYTFYIYDLMKIIHNSLTYSEYLTIKPHHPRNPYTNIPFSSHNIYNICLKLYKNVNVSLLLHSYFICNLNLHHFIKYNFLALQKYCVEQYVHTLDINVLFHKLCELIYSYTSNRLTNHIVIKYKDKCNVVNKSYKILYHYYWHSIYELSEDIDVMSKIIPDLYNIVKLFPFYFKRKNKNYTTPKKYEDIQDTSNDDEECISESSYSQHSESDSDNSVSSL